MKTNRIRTGKPWWKKILPYAVIAAVTALVFYLVRIVTDRMRS